MHPEWDVPDWDTPPGAIEWPLFVSFLRKFKTTGIIPLDRRRQDYLTTQKDVEMRDQIERWYRDSFARLELDMKGEGEKVVWGLVDGFLLGDVENGKPTGQKVRNLVLIETLEMGTSHVVEKCCKILLKHARGLEVGG